MRSLFAYAVAVVMGVMMAATCAHAFEVEVDGADDVTAQTRWNFVEQSSGENGAYDATFGDADYAGVRLGTAGLYSSSFAQGGPSGIDLDKAFLFRQEQNIGTGNDPGIEFAWMEQGNSIRMAIPESGTGNATAMIRSVTIAGPYAITNDIVTCDYWGDDVLGAGTHNIDCDTSGTGADLFVQDDFEIGGSIFMHDNLCFEGATIDGFERCFAWGSDPGADVTVTMPNSGTVTSTTENATITGDRTHDANTVTVQADATLTTECSTNDCGFTFDENTANPAAPAAGKRFIHCKSDGCYILTNGGTATPGDKIPLGSADYFSIDMNCQGTTCQGGSDNFMGVGHFATTDGLSNGFVMGFAWTPQSMVCNQANDSSCETLTFDIAIDGTIDTDCQVEFTTGGDNYGRDSDCTAVGSIGATAEVTVRVNESGAANCGTGIALGCQIVGKAD